MNDLRQAAQQALEALQYIHSDTNAYEDRVMAAAITALEAALAEPTVKESLQVESAFAENATTQQQLEEAPPSDYRRGYWDGFEIGKREGRIEAENALAEPVPVVDRCANCLRPKGEHQGDMCPRPYTTVWHAWDYEAKRAEPVQEPDPWGAGYEAGYQAGVAEYDPQQAQQALAEADRIMGHEDEATEWRQRWVHLFTAPPQRKPLTDEEIVALIHPIAMADMPDEMTDYEIARAIERAIKRAYGIGVQP